MKTSQRILVDIDCLFDTRLGLAKHLKAPKLNTLPRNVYAKRVTDTWAELVGIDDWQSKWRSRGIGALMQAGPTEFFDDLALHLERLLLEIQMHSPLERPTLTINHYPYTFSAEQREQFEIGFRSKYDMVNVTLVNIPPASLTPHALAQSWDGWYCYNWYEWIELNAKHFETDGIPQFVILRPALLSPDITPEGFEAIELEKTKGMNPFDEARRFLSRVLTVETRDVSLFCLTPELWDEISQ